MSEGYQLFGQPMHHPFGAAIKLGWNSLRQRSNLRDAHLTVSCLRSWMNIPVLVAPACRGRERFRICEVPRGRYFFHTKVLMALSRPIRFSPVANVARLARSDGSTMELLRNFHHSIKPNVSG